jgi:gliding motility-associated-like protein
MDFMVFDRLGNKVFETNNQAMPWDGTYKGEPMNTGIYVYYLKATMIDGTIVEKKGSVALVR